DSGLGRLPTPRALLSRIAVLDSNRLATSPRSIGLRACRGELKPPNRFCPGLRASRSFLEVRLMRAIRHVGTGSICGEHAQRCVKYPTHVKRPWATGCGLVNRRLPLHDFAEMGGSLVVPAESSPSEGSPASLAYLPPSFLDE